MQANLDSVRLKLVRAEEHFQSVLELIRQSNNARCEMIPEEAPDDKDFGILRVNLTPKVPAGLSTVIGDFLFNLRSALDHLIWQLVLSDGNQPASHNMFPIAKTPDIFANEAKRRRLDGVPKQAQALIETLQPYHAGNAPLFVLADLHNTDKHRTLHLVAVVASDTQVKWIDDGGPLVAMYLRSEELRDGAVFGDVALPLVFEGRSLRERFFNMKVEGYASTFVAFENPGADELEPFRVDTVLKEILDLVRDTVIPTFEPFFQ